MPEDVPRLRPGLSRRDVERLSHDRSAQARAKTAAGVAAEYAAGLLTPAEKHLAEEILDVLSRDIERRVREAVVEHVKHCPFLPTRIATALAKDVESVALPMLRYSEALAEEDLIAIVRQGAPDWQVAIAGRRRVSPALADTLIAHGDEPVVGEVLANPGAEILPRSYGRALARFGDSPRIQSLLVERPSLPITVVEFLIVRVADELRERLVERHDIAPALAEQLVRLGRERAMTEALIEDGGQGEIERLAQRLHSSGALTPTLLLRALCGGDLSFFEAAAAALAGIPTLNASILVHDAGPLGLQELYGKAGLPPDLFRAFRIAVGVACEVEHRSNAAWSPADTKRVIDRLVDEYGEVFPADLENVMSQLSRYLDGRAHPPAPQSARFNASG